MNSPDLADRRAWLRPVSDPICAVACDSLASADGPIDVVAVAGRHAGYEPVLPAAGAVRRAFKTCFMGIRHEKVAGDVQS